MPDSPSPLHSVSVAAAIFDDSGEKVLLIKRRDNGRWEPPGGVLELDETIEEGLRREVREEIGAEIDIGPLTGIYKNMPKRVVALVFRCHLRGNPSQATEEAAEIKWWAAAPSSMSAAFAVRISDARAGVIQPVRISAHDGSSLIGP